MPTVELPSFFTILSMAMRLDPAIYALIQVAPGGLAVAVTVVFLAGLSESLGQSVVLFINRIRPGRFGLALVIGAISHLIGYLVWTLTIWSSGTLFFGANAAPAAVASAVGLAYAPQVLSFLELAPFIGVLIQVVLSLWSMLAVILAVRVGLGLETWEAVAISTFGWLLLQVVRVTIGRPFQRWQRWVAGQAAGVRLAHGAKDLPNLRRRAGPTWYTQLESWRSKQQQRQSAKGPVDGEVVRVRRAH
jgi:hypothetical protein